MRCITISFAAAVLAGSLHANISGTVRDAETLAPIGGALVHLKGDQGASGVLTSPTGTFTLSVNPAGVVTVVASTIYNRAAARNYLIGGRAAVNGDSSVVIDLTPLPVNDDPNYTPAASTQCRSCHPTIYAQWSASHHANTAQNPWVRDLYDGQGTPGGNAGYVFKTSHEANETGFCATCHAPMADVRNPGNTFLDQVTEPGAREGVNCVTCHQLDSINVTHLNALHILGKATYRFPMGTLAAGAYVWGPLSDVTFSGMGSSRSTLHKDPLLCASCHQYNRPENGVTGQHTYDEWLASPYASPGPRYRTCQDCHMPPASGPGALCVFGPNDRAGAERHDHTIIGSTPETLRANLRLTATAMEVAPGRIRVTASVENFGAGHSFPTGLPIRNALLVLTARHNGVELTQVAGPTIPFWGSDEVAGNQPGDYAGYAGKGFARILQGRVNDQGPVVRPVFFVDAEAVHSDTLIPSGATDTTIVEFLLPPGVPAAAVVDVEARLLYRRAYRALVVKKGWTTSAHGGPIEIEVANRQLQVVSLGASPAIPTMSVAVLAVLMLALAAIGVFAMRAS